MKEFLVSFFVLFIIFNSYCDKYNEFYRSNFNGLLLLKINEQQRAEFKYVAVNVILDDLMLTKTLYESDKEVKRWEYTYVENKIRQEDYYKDFMLTERIIYNTDGHKLNYIEYRNRKILRNTSYEYNTDGLLNKEIVNDVYQNRVNTIKYRYDSQYRIKQIITEMYDGRIVYWDAFFTGKGIIVKEYYTLNDKRYIFYYNANGQETKGEVIMTDSANKNEPSIFWDNQYSKDGHRILKDETNKLTNKRTKLWFDADGHEIKEEKYYYDKLESIKERNYDEKGNVTSEKEIIGLTITLTKFYHKEEKLYKTEMFENGKLKSFEEINEDNSKLVTIFGINNIKLLILYDVDGNKINESYVID